MKNTFKLDSLSIFAGIISLLLLYINIFYKNRVIGIISMLVYLFFIIYRNYFLSARKKRNQNEKFIQIFHRLDHTIRSIHYKSKKKKNIKYIVCPSCNNIIKVDDRKDGNKIICPFCKTSITSTKNIK